MDNNKLEKADREIGAERLDETAPQDLTKTRSPTRREDFVTFCSPGTFVDEQTEEPIWAWSVVDACFRAQTVVERHGARPYGFYFTTKIVSDPVDDGEGGKLEVDPKTVDRSGMYFLGGDVLNYDEVVTRANDEDSILVSNMRFNDIPFVVENRNSYVTTRPFGAKDFVVDVSTGEIVDGGSTPERAAYRAEFSKRLSKYIGAWFDDIAERRVLQKAEDAKRAECVAQHDALANMIRCLMKCPKETAYVVAENMYVSGVRVSDRESLKRWAVFTGGQS